MDQTATEPTPAATTTPNRPPVLQGTIAPRERAANPIAEGVDIGHVHMRAGDLAKIRAFYVDILGFDVVFQAPSALFLAAGGYHHHLGFNTWESAGGRPAPAGTTGLYHIALRYPTRASPR
jgi:catechol 2,3-dioxygenase